MKGHCSNCVCASTFTDRTAHHFPQLQAICNAQQSKKRALLKKIDRCLLNFICDCSKGVLHHILRVPKSTYRKLRHYRDDFLLLANKKISQKAKRETLVNKNGGFLPLILPALASAVFGIIGNLISKRFIK